MIWRLDVCTNRDEKKNHIWGETDVKFWTTTRRKTTVVIIIAIRRSNKRQKTNSKCNTEKTKSKEGKRAQNIIIKIPQADSN